MAAIFTYRDDDLGPTQRDDPATVMAPAVMAPAWMAVAVAIPYLND